jgi:hypothetical protein
MMNYGEWILVYFLGVFSGSFFMSESFFTLAMIAILGIALLFWVEYCRDQEHEERKNDF